MPQPQADQQAARNAAIVALASHQLAGVWPQVDWESPAAVDAVAAVYGHIVSQFGKATAAVAALQYDELRAAQGVTSNYVADPADPMAPDVIDKAVRSAFLGRAPAPTPDGMDRITTGGAPLLPNTTSDLPVDERVPARLTASLQRYVMQPARDTVALNTANDPGQPRYIRVPRGATTCAFCVVLASREIQTVKGGKANFRGYVAANVRHDPATDSLHVFAANGQKYHNKCDCEAVPIWPDQTAADVSPNFHDFQDQYYKAAADAGTHRDLNKILASMRQLHGLS